MILCSGCPRSYHYTCLESDFKAKSKAKLLFHCPQHQCADCEQNTTNAGGMLYRCRWCERSYCEDCLDWAKTDLLGENLQEYELLGFPVVDQAFYIKCPNCHDHHEELPSARKYCEREAAKISKRYQALEKERALIAAAASIARKSTAPPTPAESWTSATTLESSGITTPRFTFPDHTSSAGSRKRKAAPKSFQPTPTKRSKRLSLD